MTAVAIQQHSSMPHSSVETSAQQQFYYAVLHALSALHNASSALSSVAVAPGSECELVPGTHIAVMLVYTTIANTIEPKGL